MSEATALLTEQQTLPFLFVANFYEKVSKVKTTKTAPRFRLQLPSCGPGSESQAHHLCFFQFVFLKLQREKNKNQQK